MLHVYAIADSAQRTEAVGLAGEELRTVGEGPFAVASEHDRLSSLLSEDDLWTHERVVEELMDRATVLPMRFDGAVADEAALRRILDERREEFQSLLAGVRGAVELGVRAHFDDLAEEGDAGHGEDFGGSDPGSPGPGTVYLLERAQDQRRAADFAARVHEPLAALSRQSRQGAAGLKPGLFKAAYLVDRVRVDAFRARIDVLDAELGSGRIVCTGPWPPYSFSSEKGA
ncbi:MAG: GvpL/GvpF family gas vesicle protein [Solirubrobacterales bacterium]